MVAQAVFEGVIPEEGIGDLLGGLEEIGTTGVLAFQSTAGSGTIRLVHGQIADREATAEEERALEILLSLREGQFAVYPKLPHLPVSRGTDTTRRGSLAVHPPAELMRYCENAGLTGRLLLEHRGRLAIGYYERGELVDVSIDGGTAGDFVTALEWTEGTFRVDAVPPPRETLPLRSGTRPPMHLRRTQRSFPCWRLSRRGSPRWAGGTTRRCRGCARESTSATRTPPSASSADPAETSCKSPGTAGTLSTILPPFRRNLLQQSP